MNLQRLATIGQVLAPLLLTALAVNAALEGVSALRPGWIPSYSAGEGFIDDARGRVARAAELRRAGTLLADEPVVAIVGASDAREGFDLAALAELDGRNSRYLGLGVSGAFDHVVEATDGLFAENFIPELTVVALASLHLMTPRATAPARWNATSAGRYCWLVRRAPDLQGHASRLLGRARARLFAAWGVGRDLQSKELSRAQQTFRQAELDEDNPWREMLQVYDDRPVDDSARVKLLELFTARGYFEPHEYRIDSDRARMVRTLLRRLREQPGKVVLVLMPQHSLVRERMPAEAMALVAQIAGEANPGAPIDVIDHRASMRDEELRDLLHLTPAGRLRFSRLVAPEIGARIPASRHDFRGRE